MNDSVYFIAEIGINHNGDLQIAKRLIDATFACQWNCVKFQKRDPDLCVPEAQKNIPKDTPWGKMTYLEYKKKIEFGKIEYDYIDKYCKEKPIDWSASVWDLHSFDFIDSYSVPFIKIPSAHLTNLELLKTVAQRNRRIILSTGMSTLDEIDAAVAVVKDNCAVAPVIMHTNSSYPTPVDELNLNIIPFLRERYGCEVGYSGHEEDLEPTVLAASLGATVIERHITLDHNMWGTDQKASLEIQAMNMLRKRIKDISVMMGDGVKRVTKSEIDIRKKLRGN